MEQEELPIRERLAGIADQKYPDTEHQQELFETFMSGVDATLALLEEEETKTVADLTRVETSYWIFYRMSEVDAWFRSLQNYSTLEVVNAMWKTKLADGNAKIYEIVKTISPQGIQTTERLL